MEIIKYMIDDLLLIVPSSIKQKVIKEICKLDSFFSFKIIDEIQLKQLVCFDYSINAIDYIAKNYNVNHSIAKEYIESMYYFDNVTYKSNRLNILNKIKQELIDNDLLSFSPSFKNIIKDKKVIVYGFDNVSKELTFFLNKLEKEYQIIGETYKEVNNTLYAFETLEEEVDALCYQISVLLHNGVDINKIKVANYNNDYLFTMKRYFKMYNIAINLNEQTPLFSYYCIKEFYNDYLNNKSIEESLKTFKDKYPDEHKLYRLLVNVCNQLVSIDDKESLKYLLKNTSTKEETLKNAVEIIDVNNCYIEEDEYVFVLSVNQSILPRTYKDEEFLSDKERNELGIDSSEDKNILAKSAFEKLINKSNNIIMSYKEKTAFSRFNKSFVLNELQINESSFIKNNMITFSKEKDELNLAKVYDYIYQKDNDYYINLLASNYDIEYKSYEHVFKRFDPEKIKAHITNSKKSISYSSISNYFACGFRYYLANLLNVGKQIKSRSIDIGLIFHKVLELSYKPNFDFDAIYDEETSKVEDVVTKFYLDKFKGLLKDIIKINNDNLKDSRLTSVITEKKVAVEYQEPINITFKGFVDKILYHQEDDKTYVSIIDYKTGSPDIDVSKVQHGLSLQLPIYLYLLKHTSEFKNVVVCGFYLQKLLPKQIKADQDYYQTITENIALQGYSNSSISVLSMFDPHFANSTLIKGMKLKKDGNFNTYSKVLSTSEMNDISNQVEEKIKDALNKICECDFDINPKILKGKNEGCKFCEFKECCFVTHDDYCYLDDVKEDEEFYETAGDYNGN